MALHFLDPDPFMVKDHSEGEDHQLELFEAQGTLFLRITVNGEPSNYVTAELTKKQATQFAEAADSLATRLLD